ncbi:unnamed protein product [Cuscuta campestris]|uniref:DUF7812 domain-containing protein n=1 Tax=Cuscuta campestris TaxID=132261 RepID=A0A484L0R7_9ASTE|nr:unnamed protein product [Cuscuta campestris]
MAPRRPRKKICIDSQREKPNSPMQSNLSPTLRKLLSAITTPGGMKAPVLKSLYCLLFHLSTGPQNRVDENDLQAVCDFIFKELSVMFDNIISPVYDISVKKERKGISFPKSLFHPCLHDNDDFTTTSSEELAVSIHFCEPLDLQTSFAIALLEVFLDELLVHGRLKAIFKRIGQITYPSEPLFMPQPTDKDAIEAFLDRLFCARNKDFEFFKAQGMSLTGAISLLLHPMFFSAPNIVQAHLVSSVYEAMSSVMDIPKLKLNCKLLNYCISVFEKSMDMYMKHMSCVWTKGHPLSICASFVEPHTHGGYCPLPFASYIMPSTLEKINSLITRLEGSSDSFLCNHFFALKSDLASSCIAYVKECQCLLDQLCRPDVFSIVNCLIVRASESFDETRMPAIRDISLQDICLLVAVLKLMSISLLHAISCLRNKESCGSFKTLKDYSLCKEYMSIVCASSCFSKCQLHFPVQEFLFGIMETNSIKHKDFMMMLVHFSGLLAFSFLNRFDYLAKGCLLTITAVLNLFVLEDGYLDELRSLVVSGPYSVSSALPLALVNQRPSIKVASKFQNMQNLHLRKSKTVAKCFGSKEEEEEGFAENSSNVYHFPDSEDNRVSIEEETTLNGESYLKTMQYSTHNTSDYDELADFVACKPGKDYAVWLNDRKKYRKWKSERTAMLMRNRKKKTLKVFKR